MALDENVTNRILDAGLKNSAKGKKYSDFLKKIKEKRKRNANQTFKRNPINFFLNFNVNMEIEEDENKKISDEGKIWVDSELMYKADIVNLTNKVLRKTQFIKAKNKNAKDVHVGEGKMSITQGLSINKFCSYYSVK